MKRVLVFPCGSEVGLEIHRSMRYSTHFELVGGSSVVDHGSMVFDEHVDDLPFADAPTFIDGINRVVAERSIDLVIPAHDSAVVALALAAETGVLDCTYVGSPYETCRVTRSKRLTYELLGATVRCPAMLSPESVSDWPVFLKPEVGQGSKGTHLATSRAELELFLARDPTLLVLEYLPGPEFTVDCFSNNSGELQFSGARTRSRVANGISVRSEPVDDAEIDAMARAINGALDLRGAWFFQVKADTDGRLALLEVAPRIAGTSGLARARGVNLPLLSAFSALDVDVKVSPHTARVLVDRALASCYQLDLSFDYVYIDLDDLILVNDRVNVEAIGFVFECRNRGVPVHLVTRHAGHLPDTLKKFGLSELFDDITWIQDGSSKAGHVTVPTAIFVDDSFAEREAVRRQTGVPVFDTHMLDLLASRPLAT